MFLIEAGIVDPLLELIRSAADELLEQSILLLALLISGTLNNHQLAFSFVWYPYLSLVFSCLSAGSVQYIYTKLDNAQLIPRFVALLEAPLTPDGIKIKTCMALSSLFTHSTHPPFRLCFFVEHLYNYLIEVGSQVEMRSLRGIPVLINLLHSSNELLLLNTVAAITNLTLYYRKHLPISCRFFSLR